ncbi:MAG: hypothetical protein JNM43_19030 [Planctomycetaceae bacterium]|nr:hypothetical protein [Planctomycetaceae bacterium]
MSISQKKHSAHTLKTGHQDSRTRGPREARILLVIGDGRRGVITRRLAQWYDLIIVFDVASEIEKKKAQFRSIPNIIYFPLGAGTTAATLFEEAPEHLRHAVQQLAPLNADDGMGSLPGIGCRAVEMAINSPEFSKLAEYVADRILIDTNGAPTRVGGRTVFSDSGGTGSGDPTELTRALIRKLCVLQVPIDWDYEPVGSITFAGLATRAHLNAASSQWRLLRKLIRTPLTDCPLVVESCRLMELLPFVNDQASRDRMVALDEQSWTARRLQDYLTLIKPNSAMNGKYGLTNAWQLDRSEQLDPRTEIVPVVAVNLRLTLLDGLLQAEPQPARVTSLEVDPSAVELPRESVEFLLEQDLDPADLIEEICKPGTHHEFRLTAIIDADQEFSLERLEFDFQNSPRSLTEFTNSVQILGSIEIVLSQRIAECHELCMSLESEKKDLSAVVADLNEDLRSGRWLLFPSRRKRTVSLHETAEDLRAVADDLRFQQMLTASLDAARSRVVKELTFLVDSLKKVASILQEWCPRGTRRVNDEAPILVRSSDDAFADLWTLPHLSPQEQIDVLSQQTAAVTLSGMARLVGTEEARQERIAQCIAEDCFIVQGPPLGSKVMFRESQEVIVLPPLPAEYRETLPPLISELRPETIVVVADTASAGVTVVRYTFFTADTLADLFPGRLRADLLRAYQHPQRALFFPEGTDGLEDDLRDFGMIK